MPANQFPSRIETVDPVPDTPAPIAEPPQEGKITYTAEQQAHVNELIREAQGRAARELRAERDQLKRDLEAARRATPAPAAEDTGVQLAEARAELASLKQERQESTLRESLRQAVSGLFVDDFLAADILKLRVRVNSSGKPVVIGPDGSEQLGADFNPQSLEEAARKLAQEKPFLAKSTVLGGSGSVPSRGVPPAPRPTAEQVFKGANGALAVKLHRENPELYAAIRREAVALGILPR